jgi:Domain of unknown function (DUF1844)
MSSLWTPDGERPVRRTPDPAPAAASPSQPGPMPTDLSADDVAALQDELAEAQREILSVPASAIVANHAIGLFQLAAVHLQTEPPNLDDARLAIDAMGALVDGLHGRLGMDEDTLDDALAQIRLAFVQISSGSGG